MDYDSTPIPPAYSQEHADEVATIVTTMRENRSAYNKDEGMQARLRDLYAAGEGQQQARGRDLHPAEQSEMATLNGMLNNRHSEYWKGPNAEKNQARYRELLAAQEPSGQGSQPTSSRHQLEDERDDAGGAPIGDEPLTLPQGLPVPEEFAGDELAEYTASLAGSAGLPADVMADIFAAQVHGGFLERDATDRQEGLAELRNVWGDATDANLAKINRYIENNLPDNIREALHAPARRSDGRAIASDPTILVTLLGLANKGAEGGDIKAIERAMRTPGYRSDSGLQLRYHYLQRQRGKGGR